MGDQTQTATATADEPVSLTKSPKEILGDPNFHALPFDDRMKVMSQADPNFAALPAKDKLQVIAVSHANQVVGKVPPPPDISGNYPGTSTFLSTTGERLKDLGKGALHTAENAEVGDIAEGAYTGVKNVAKRALGFPMPGQGGSQLPEMGATPAQPLNVVSNLTNAGAEFMGGNIPKAEAARYAAAQRGDPNPESDPEYLANKWGVPLATAGVGAILKEVLPARTPAQVAPVRREIEALTTIIGQGVREGEPQMVAQTVQPLWKQAAQELGETDATLAEKLAHSQKAPQSNLVGSTRAGARQVLNIASRAVDVADRPIAEAVRVYGDQPGQQIAQGVVQEMERAATSVEAVDPEMAASIRRLQARVLQNGSTLGDLQSLKVQANKEMEGLFSGVPGKDAQATLRGQYAYSVLGDAIRGEMYPELQRLGAHFDVKGMGAREAAAIQARDGAYSLYYRQVAPAEAQFASQSYLGRVFGGSLYKTHILRRALNLGTPAGQFAASARRGIGPMGEMQVPETVQTTFGAPEVTPPPGAPPNPELYPPSLPEGGGPPSSGPSGQGFGQPPGHELPGEVQPTDRRTAAGSEFRKQVSHMSPEEKDAELLTSQQTALPNRRAFWEAEQKQGPAGAYGISDVNGLKFMNDTFGYDAGDALLKVKAKVLMMAGLDAYHFHGDEFGFRGATTAELGAKLDMARQIMQNAQWEFELPNGKRVIFKGGDFEYGTGASTDEAEAGLHSSKAARPANGARGQRGSVGEVVDASTGQPFDFGNNSSNPGGGSRSGANPGGASARAQAGGANGAGNRAARAPRSQVTITVSPFKYGYESPGGIHLSPTRALQPGADLGRVAKYGTAIQAITPPPGQDQ